MQANSVEAAEVAKFAAMAEEWWDPKGSFRPLHMLNPSRLDYITGQICAEFRRDHRSLRPLTGLDILDIGCGGGLVCEPMARLGGTVVGADATAESIGVAKHHAAQSGLAIDYRHCSAEDLRDAGDRFDVVLALEIVEHVTSPADFLACCRELVKPGGLLIVSTLNRTLASYAVGIVGAEYIMRWLPPGTHAWSRFIRPDEMEAMLKEGGATPIDRRGLAYAAASRSWSLSDSKLDVNYLMTARA